MPAGEGRRGSAQPSRERRPPQLVSQRAGVRTAHSPPRGSNWVNPVPRAARPRERHCEASCEARARPYTPRPDHRTPGETCTRRRRRRRGRRRRVTEPVPARDCSRRFARPTRMLRTPLAALSTRSAFLANGTPAFQGTARSFSDARRSWEARVAIQRVVSRIADGTRWITGATRVHWGAGYQDIPLSSRSSRAVVSQGYSQ